MSAINEQIGGNHYKDMKIQPVEFITKNKIGFLEGCVIKRLCRYMKKENPLEDLNKCIHEIYLIKELADIKSDIKNKKLEEPESKDLKNHKDKVFNTSKDHLNSFIHDYKELIKTKQIWDKDDLRILINGLLKTRY